MVIKVYTEELQDREFYGWLGPYFADRSIMEEMTLPLYNEPGAIWFVGFNNEEVIGFCTIFKNKRSSKNLKAEKYLYFDNFYIVPAYRGKGHSRELFDYRMNYVLENFQGWIIEAMSRDARQLQNYKNFNFTVTGKRGSYSILKREL